MNKDKFIEELGQATGLSKEKSTIVNSILEDNFILGKKHKEAIVAEIAAQLKLDSAEAEKIYEAAMSVLGSGIKDKLKHPFGAQE